jgi:adenosyl cobinamide kinase/adenosyl cobinamide phosphate guanylyltransferase
MGGQVIAMAFLFLCVLAVCATVLLTSKMHHDSIRDTMPKCTREEFEAIKTAHNNLSRVVTTVANKVGLSAKLHSAE